MGAMEAWTAVSSGYAGRSDVRTERGSKGPANSTASFDPRSRFTSRQGGVRSGLSREVTRLSSWPFMTFMVNSS